MADYPHITEPYGFPGPQGQGGDPVAWWRLSDGSTVWAAPGSVTVADRQHCQLEDIEADALAMLAACAWARRGRT